MKKIIENNAPYPLSKAIVYNSEFITEISGQIGVDPKTGELVEGIENQTVQTLENIKQILKEVGWDLKNVVKTTVYLSDMNNYAKMNEVYGKYFTKDYPARAAIGINELPRKALIEIECIAIGDQII